MYALSVAGKPESTIVLEASNLGSCDAGWLGNGKSGRGYCLLSAAFHSANRGARPRPSCWYIRSGFSSLTSVMDFLGTDIT